MFPPHTLVAMKRKPQSIAAFAGLPFVGQIETTMGGKVFRQLCREADVTPHVVLTTANILTLLNLCVAGLGVCTLPSTFVRQSDALPGLRGAGIVGPETLRRVTVFELNSATGSAQLAVNRLRSKMLTQAGREFIHLAQELFHD